MKRRRRGNAARNRASAELAKRATAAALGQTPGLTAIIPAGGHGHRMAPVTGGMPKTLIPLHERPLLIAILESLEASGVFKEAIVLCNHWHAMIKRYVDAFFPGDRAQRSGMTVECDAELGRVPPPKALLHLCSSRRLTDPFLLHYCDVYAPDLDWREFRDDFAGRRSRTPALIGELVVSSRHQQTVGLIKYDEGTKLIKDFQQKPSTFERETGANTAIGLFMLDFVRNYIEEDDHDVFDRSVSHALKSEQRALATFLTQTWFHFDHAESWTALQQERFRES